MDVDWLENFGRMSLGEKIERIKNVEDDQYDTLCMGLRENQNKTVLLPYRKLILDCLKSGENAKKHAHTLGRLFHFHLRSYANGECQRSRGRLGSKEMREWLDLDPLLSEVEIRMDDLSKERGNGVVNVVRGGCRHWVLVWNYEEDGGSRTLFDSSGKTQKVYEDDVVSDNLWQPDGTHTCGYYVLWAAHQMSRGYTLDDLEDEYLYNLDLKTLENLVVQFVKDVYASNKTAAAAGMCE